MKKLLFVFTLLLAAIPLTAQISEIERIFFEQSNNYKQYTSIVRNYDSKYNVLMLYGYVNNAIYNDSIKGRSTFMIQNTITGDITHLVDLPQGYQVNDVRFVTLRRIDGESTVDFCCFCGTRTQVDDIIYLPALPGEPTLISYAYSTHGFAGFFSMDDALSPSTSCTAKVRNVEKTKELYRMVCYAENHGHYYSYQNSFLDNAVLDIIGLDDTVNAPSCFCRAKFYPDCYGSVRWDNNMRFNSTEVLTDITKTDKYVVTVSNNITGDSLWIRYSDLEDHLVYGGLQLNNYVNSILFSSLEMYYDCDNYFGMESFYRNCPAKICHTKDDGIEIGFGFEWQRNTGLLNCQYVYSGGTLSYLQGAYLKTEPTVKELIHMPLNNATAVLFNENQQDYVSVITWNKNSSCIYSVRRFFGNTIDVQSITLQERNGYEHLLWSGKETGNHDSPMYLMSQRGAQGGGYEQSCHSNFDETAQKITLEHRLVRKPLDIQIRFTYDEVTWPTTSIHFNPYGVPKEFDCVREN